MHDSSSGSTIGIRPRRTPEPPAVNELTYVASQSICSASGDRARSRRSRCPVTLPAVTGVSPSSTIIATRGDGRSARPLTQKRPVTLGSSVVPEMSLPPSSMTSTSISANGSGGDEVAGLVGEGDLGRRRRPRRPSARARVTTSPDGDSTDATPPSTRPVPRSASMPSSSWSRITTRAARRGTGRRRAACRSRRRPSSCSRSRSGRGTPVCGFIRFTGRMRSAAGGVDVEVQRAAGRVVGDDDGLHRRADLGVERRRRSCRAWRASPAGPRRWPRRGCPSPGRRTAPRRGRAGRRSAPRSSSTRPVRPRLPAPTATVMPGGDGAGEAPDDLVARRRLDVGDGRRVRDAGSSTSVSGGTVIDGSIGSVDAGVQLLPSHVARSVRRFDWAAWLGDETLRRGDLRVRHGVGMPRRDRALAAVAVRLVRRRHGRARRRPPRCSIAPDDAVAAYVRRCTRSTRRSSRRVGDRARPTACCGSPADRSSPTSTLGRPRRARAGRCGACRGGRHEPALGDGRRPDRPPDAAPASARAATTAGGEEFYGATDRHRVDAGRARRGTASTSVRWPTSTRRCASGSARRRGARRSSP